MSKSIALPLTNIFLFVPFYQILFRNAFICTNILSYEYKRAGGVYNAKPRNKQETQQKHLTQEWFLPVSPFKSKDNGKLPGNAVRFRKKYCFTKYKIKFKKKEYQK